MKSRFLTIFIGLILPTLLCLAAFPFYNRIEPYVLGFSFNYFWMFMCMLAGSVCLFIAYKIDPLNKVDDEENKGGEK